MEPKQKWKQAWEAGCMVHSSKSSVRQGSYKKFQIKDITQYNKISALPQKNKKKKNWGNIQIAV